MSKSQRDVSSMPEGVDRSGVVVRGSASGFAQEVFAATWQRRQTQCRPGRDVFRLPRPEVVGKASGDGC
jgi:hypothetical protein